MTSVPLSRSTYRDPNSPGNPVRAGNTTHLESAMDMDQYYRPLEAIHDTNAHGPGIGSGLTVKATLNSQNLAVLAGAALDANGRHISLAVGGNAEIGQNADANGASPTLTGVTATGAVFPTLNLGANDYYLTIQFWEWFDSDAYLNLGVYRYNHTPWIRLLATAGFVDDGIRLVLAKVTLDAGGNVTALTNDIRHGTDLPVESIHLRKGAVVTGGPTPAVDNVPSGEIRSRPQGGITMKVQDPADEIHLERDGGNIAKVVIGANQVDVGVVNNPGVVLDGAGANIIAGTAGNEGDILVKDGGNRLTVAINGASGHVIVGAEGVPGQVRMLNQGGGDSLHLDGASGAAVVKRLDPFDGALIDSGARFFRIHGWDLVLDGRSGQNNRALVDWGNELIVNFVNDFSNGVEVNGLHLSQHIEIQEYTYFNTDKQPTYNQWFIVKEWDTGIPTNWMIQTTSETGWFDNGTVDHFWFAAHSQVRADPNGHWFVQLRANYFDTGDDWRPWVSFVKVTAFRP